MKSALLSTSLPLRKRSGKVRDVYSLGETLLIVATDRISAYDCIMPNGIPDKGRILTALSLFWFDKFAGEFPNHVLGTQMEVYPDELEEFRDQLDGRSMLVRKTQVVPIECVARGYLAGSGWEEYKKSGTVCGVKLPAGLKQCDKLPEPIFTPATKEESGHDINISYEQACDKVGRNVAGEIRDQTLALYSRAADYAAQRGVIIADTKFEFGHTDEGKIILIDEVLTPDSSRFWPAEKYAPGRDQESFDKQFVRNYLSSLTWDKTPPAPELPVDVVAGTRAKYLEAYEKITGKVLRL